MSENRLYQLLNYILRSALMHIQIMKGNILESDAEAIVLTVDDARKGMERNKGKVDSVNTWNK